MAKAPGKPGRLLKLGTTSAGQASRTAMPETGLRCGSFGLSRAPQVYEQAHRLLRFTHRSASRRSEKHLPTKSPSPLETEPSSRRPNPNPKVCHRAPLLRLSKDRPFADIHFASPLPARPKPCLRSLVATPETRSALVVLPDFDGLLLAELCGFVAPRSQPWGSPSFGQARKPGVP
jgi:hypothetical protein